MLIRLTRERAIAAGDLGMQLDVEVDIPVGGIIHNPDEVASIYAVAGDWLSGGTGDFSSLTNVYEGSDKKHPGSDLIVIAKEAGGMAIKIITVRDKQGRNVIIIYSTIIDDKPQPLIYMILNRSEYSAWKDRMENYKQGKSGE